MTTKKELREALQRLADEASEVTGPCRGSCCRALADATDAARAILARPAVVVGYRLRLQNGAAWTWRIVDNGGKSPLACRDYGRDSRRTNGGKLYRLVVR